MKLRHSKSSSEDIEPSIESSTMSSTDTENTWKCPSCGAMNEDFRKFCDGCGDKRPGAAVTAAKGISMDEILGSSSPTEEQPEPEEEKPKGKPKKAKKEKKSKKKVEDEEMEEPERLQPSIPEPEPFTAPTVEPTDDFESKPSNDDSGSKPSFVLTGAEPTPSIDDTSPKDISSSFQSTPTLSEPPAPSAPSAPLPAGARYYLVFVSTPASSLVKTRVAVEFEDFPTVTIGRSPENVVVIPDPEVSRKHASLNFDGRRITLRDLGSSNGSFVYNGADFQRVSDSVEVRPNTVIKFGTGTIVKLVTE
jgi:hypothetical protein